MRHAVVQLLNHQIISMISVFQLVEQGTVQEMEQKKFAEISEVYKARAPEMYNINTAQNLPWKAIWVPEESCPLHIEAFLFWPIQVSF